MQTASRRTFLAGAGAAVVLRAQGPEPVGTAIIGTGGRGSYLLRYAMAQPGVKITALCDIKPERLDKAASAAARDNPATYRDYKQLLERPDVNAVYIASPCDLHAEMALAAIAAGKHVFCEKPIGITVESVLRLAAAARAAKTVFQVGQQTRASRRMEELIARLREGVAGKLVMIRAQRHASDDLAHNGTSADWFFDASRSGDVLVEMSVHNLDACNWILGERPARAAGFGGTLVYTGTPPGRTNMDGYSLTYEYPGGAKLSYMQSFFHPRGMPGGGSATYVYGAKGGVDMASGIFYPHGREGKPETLVPPREEDLNDLHAKDFLEAIRTGKRPRAGIEEGASGAITAIIGREAIYQKTVTNWP